MREAAREAKRQSVEWRSAVFIRAFAQRALIGERQRRNAGAAVSANHEAWRAFQSGARAYKVRGRRRR